MRKFDNNNINYNKLIEYGFTKEKGKYIYNKKIHNDEFNVIVIVEDKEITSKIIEVDSNLEYVLVDTSQQGAFILELNNEYEKVLDDILNSCLENNIYKSTLTKEVINYIENKYNGKLEYLWEKFPSYAVIRNKDNNKWYALIATLEKNKLVGNSNEIIDILNLRCDKSVIDSVIDNINIFPGYHMNKKSWISINLCGNISLEDVYNLIDKSYELSKGK